MSKHTPGPDMPDEMDLTRNPITGDWRLRRFEPENGLTTYEVSIREHHIAWLVNALTPYAGGPFAAAPDLWEAVESAPVLSKYHGVNGFELERFIADYEAWTTVRMALLEKATP